jgi:tryptophan synthase alpha chain
MLFSYLNPLLKFGRDQLVEEVQRAGIDAVLITDLTPEEGGPWITAFRDHAVDLIFLVAPTTSDERLRRIAQQASGFIYAVSRAGVTGARNEMPHDAESLVKRVRAVSDLPIAVGFGISTSEQVRQVWHFADAAVIGSALVSQVEKLAGSPDLVNRVGEFARSLLAPTNHSPFRGR